jgi:hypothetical protein
VVYFISVNSTNPMSLEKKLHSLVAEGSFVRALSTSSPIFANVTVSASLYVTDLSPTFSPTIPPSSATPTSPYTEMAIQARVSSFAVSNPIAITLMIVCIVVFLSAFYYCCCGTKAITQRNKVYLHNLMPALNKNKVDFLEGEKKLNEIRKDVKQIGASNEGVGINEGEGILKRSKQCVSVIFYVRIHLHRCLCLAFHNGLLYSVPILSLLLHCLSSSFLIYSYPSYIPTPSLETSIITPGICIYIYIYIYIYKYI